MEFWEVHKEIKDLYEVMGKPVREKYGLKQLELDILMFLHANPDVKTASEIVRIRHLSKSHVSTSIKRLEALGMVKVEYIDKKSQQLIVCQKALPCIEDGKSFQNLYMKTILEGFEKEDVQNLSRLIGQLCSNAERGIKQYESSN